MLHAEFSCLWAMSYRDTMDLVDLYSGTISDRNESVVRLNQAQSAFCWKEKEKVINITATTVVLVPVRWSRKGQDSCIPLAVFFRAPVEPCWKWLSFWRNHCPGKKATRVTYKNGSCMQNVDLGWAFFLASKNSNLPYYLQTLHVFLLPPWPMRVSFPTGFCFQSELTQEFETTLF